MPSGWLVLGAPGGIPISCSMGWVKGCVATGDCRSPKDGRGAGPFARAGVEVENREGLVFVLELALESMVRCSARLRFIETDRARSVTLEVTVSRQRM